MSNDRVKTSGVQELVDRLRQDGVAEGQNVAASLLEDARREASEIVDLARREAAEISDEAAAGVDTSASGRRGSVAAGCPRRHPSAADRNRGPFCRSA